MADSSKIFREKSLQRIQSPEKLDEYIKVANPGTLIVLLAIVLTIAGIAVWGIFGKVERSVPAMLISDGEYTFCCMDKGETLNAGMEIVSDESRYEVTDSVLCKSSRIKECIDTLKYDEEDTLGEIFEIKTNERLPIGVYRTRIVVEAVSPISLI